MAQIRAVNDMSVLKIRSFLGLNENPDGDTVLKTGELSEMRNFRITQDGHLQIRPGSETAVSLYETLFSGGGENIPDKSETRCAGCWRGSAAGRTVILVAYYGKIFEIDLQNGTARVCGTATDSETTFFAFGGNVYLLNGIEYQVWDGGSDTGFQEVSGYVPLVQVATTPAGSGTLLENVNRLTGKRRVRFSPDGNATVFQLPEKEITAVYQVTPLVGSVSGYTVNTTQGTVTFSSAPAAGTDSLEIAYEKGTGFREQVTAMRYAELFNGNTDTRVFLYGDGSNKTIYSGIPYDTGQPSAEYFPDLFEATVGESNTPITALVRHFSRLMAYKPDSAWVLIPGDLTLDDNQVTSVYYVQPVNRQFGNEAVGQVKLLENNPITLDAGSVYQWVSTTNGSGYLSGNENNAKRISDRVAITLRSFDFRKTRTVNIKQDHEFWFLYDGKALILNYANNTWYAYYDLPFSRLLEADGEKLGISENGDILRIGRRYRNDDKRPIACYAATGAMDFGRDWELKYSPMLFVAMQPESNARIQVTVESNRRSDYPEKTVAYSLANFSHVDFRHFSFSTNRKPQVKRLKMKVKKAVFYRILFKSNSASATATVIEADVRLRYAGNT